MNHLPTHDQRGSNGLPASAHASLNVPSDSVSGAPGVHETQQPGAHSNMGTCVTRPSNEEGTAARAPLPDGRITICGWCAGLISGEAELYREVREGRVLPSTGCCGACKEKLAVKQRAVIFKAMIEGNLQMADQLIKVGSPGMALSELKQACTKFSEFFQTL